LLLSDKRALDEAREALRRATQLDGGYAAAWNGLGRVEQKRKQLPAAVEALGRARRLEPTNAGYAADLCRAVVDQDPKAAQGPKICRDALSLAPQNALARYVLGKSLVARGDCASAKAELDRFAALPGVKPEAKQGAQALLAACGGKPR
jgi:cytochrome c-type biogenesis protein CcmH/NrfG